MVYKPTYNWGGPILYPLVMTNIAMKNIFVISKLPNLGNGLSIPKLDTLKVPDYTRPGKYTKN